MMRQASSYAIDKQTIVKRIFRGGDKNGIPRREKLIFLGLGEAARKIGE